MAHIPESLEPTEAAPLMCAGMTTFNALRDSGAMPSDLVAVKESAGLAAWEFSLQGSSAIESRSWDEARVTRLSRKSSERMFISTASRPTLQPNCKNLAARA